jgi:hypothetical protein
MFCRKGGKSSLQEAAIEIGVVGDNEYYPVEQIVDSVIVDALTGDHLVGNVGDLDDLAWDRKTRIFEPPPAAQNSIDPPALPVVLDGANAQFDNLVAIGIGSRGFDSTTAATSFGVLSGGWYSACGSSRLLTR